MTAITISSAVTYEFNKSLNYIKYFWVLIYGFIGLFIINLIHVNKLGSIVNTLYAIMFSRHILQHESLRPEQF